MIGILIEWDVALAPEKPWLAAHRAESGASR